MRKNPRFFGGQKGVLHGASAIPMVPSSKEVNTPFEVLRHSDQTATVTIPDIFAEAPAVPVMCWVHGFQFLIVFVCFCCFLRSLLKDSLWGDKKLQVGQLLKGQFRLS